MKPRPSEGPRAQSSKSFQGEGSNWILIAGGALLSTLSFRLGYKLKQVLDAKQPQDTCNGLKGNGNSADRKMLGGCQLHSNGYCFPQDEGGCFNYISGTRGVVEHKQQSNDQLVTEPDTALPLVTVPPMEFNKDSVVVWASSPDRLEPPQKPFHHSNCSDSPCVSESGSDIFSKREVIQKLRQQLKRRDDMILEMQDQIVELQSSLSSQISHSSHMQSLLDAANRDLLDSEREIQRLRKAIADHCVGQVGLNDNPSTVPIWPYEGRNGHANGYLYGENGLDCSEKGRGDGERIEMLKREVVELKEVIEGKEYLLQNYKGQKAELSVKVKELQLRLDNQLPNIL
ncbi:uncharacterized protein LOC130781283 isoform X1 [Actinidia eriantha]|uniref:uncharacterized protein LOC130781283 isoform X1 n=1 Tax=Actinidia eriantha TaxID=165200 RepID=UPI0025860B00|nr:uncharacterized protein LOC130781283 isoform X1 [Actinidia eriantha]XP_057496413.1 uncharacterized protein LOC130781283 isoform X1 [Actinidia eriantha]XP_057496414.1 uncharacterized protein LOC130781283 isoform X1 [Actinidia eriantha]XP_057496415.1 uncharacterized protein LOC130781283 isoform X1 [Actinidia eriantha]XP_057496416.1 uncharacterized protein LOC130781283 isoform X1 [Actinidia eriantha]XP_057496417.1 uncharacterized protein LOC130781283 isoform X1 [Actinidia eriantha]